VTVVNDGAGSGAYHDLDGAGNGCVGSAYGAGEPEGERAEVRGVHWNTGNDGTGVGADTDGERA
jgi:hypothetical protein